MDPPVKKIRSIPKLVPIETEQLLDKQTTSEVESTQPSSTQEGHTTAPKKVRNVPKMTPLTEKLPLHSSEEVGESREEKRERLRQAIKGKKQARTHQDIFGSTKKELARNFKSKGLSGALAQLGINDPIIQDILSKAVMSGQINDQAAMIKLIDEYYTKSGMKDE